jgi:cation channel sperm-associated protein 3
MTNCNTDNLPVLSFYNESIKDLISNYENEQTIYESRGESNSRASENASNRQRFDAGFHEFCLSLTKSAMFRNFIIATTILNAIVIGVESEYGKSIGNVFFFRVLNELFVGIYTFEFILRIYAEPFNHFKNVWHWFDFTSLLEANFQIIIDIIEFDGLAHSHTLYYLRSFKTLRSFRVIRTISFIKGLKVILSALIYTITVSVANVTLVILIIMFTFAIVGNSFLYESVEWNNLAASMWTLFRYICCDEWPDLQKSVDHISGSKYFTIFFVFIGNFIFANIFIGLIIMNISDAHKDYQLEKLREKALIIKSKKDLIYKKQIEEINKLTKRDISTDMPLNNFKELLKKYKSTIKHKDTIQTNELCLNVCWIERFKKALNCFDNNMFILKNLYYEMSHVLALIINDRLNEQSQNDKK